MTDRFISIEAIAKRYPGADGGEIAVFEDLWLAMARGEFVCVIGHSGCGKTTVLNILAGLVIKTGGTAQVFGIDIDRHPRRARRAIGVVPQELNLDAFFTPRETLELQAGLYGVPKAERATAAESGLTVSLSAVTSTMFGWRRVRSPSIDAAWLRPFQTAEPLVGPTALSALASRVGSLVKSVRTSAWSPACTTA